MTIRIILTVALAMASTAAAAQKTTTKVEVDGKTYRVTRSGETVVVARKSLIVAFDIAERDRQREAARKVTGCAVVDELPGQDGRLRGRLDCADVKAATPQ